MLGVMLLTASMAAEALTCMEALNNLASLEYPDAKLMLYYSGRDFDQLGQYDECNKLSSSKYVLIQTTFRETNAVLGFCGPKECSSHDYKEASQYLISEFGLSEVMEGKELNFIFSKEYNDEPMSAGGVFMVILWVLILLVVGLGTFFDQMVKKNSEIKLGPVSSFLTVFSLIENGKKLFSLPESYDNLQLFNGVRVVGIFWIVYGHCYTYQFLGAISNPFTAIDWLSDLEHKFPEMGQYLVDVFFLMAGFLLAYLTIAQLKAKRGRMNWFVFIIHRFIRMIPIYWFALFNFLLLLRYIGSGPQWPLYGDANGVGCQTYWWSNMIFLNNFFPAHEFSCMGWTWYIANDVQFYCMAPIVLILYYRSKLWGYLACFTLFAVNFISIGTISSVNHFTPTVLDGLSNKDQFLYLYIKPYTRMAPYIMGLMIGFMYRSYCDMNPSPNKEYEQLEEGGPKTNNYVDPITRLELLCTKWVFNRWLRYLAYIAGLTLMFTIGLLPYQIDKHGQDYWTQSQKSAFLTFEHFAFSFGFSLILIPMLLGYCRGLLYVLTIRYLAPIAKITFSIYVVHPIVIYWYVFSKDQAIYLQELDIFIHFLATSLISVFLGGLLSLMVESPILTLEKKYLRKGH